MYFNNDNNNNNNNKNDNNNNNSFNESLIVFVNHALLGFYFCQSRRHNDHTFWLICWKLRLYLNIVDLTVWGYTTESVLFMYFDWYVKN